MPASVELQAGEFNDFEGDDGGWDVYALKNFFYEKYSRVVGNFFQISKRLSLSAPTCHLPKWLEVLLLVR